MASFFLSDASTLNAEHMAERQGQPEILSLHLLPIHELGQDNQDHILLSMLKVDPPFHKWQLGRKRGGSQQHSSVTQSQKQVAVDRMRNTAILLLWGRKTSACQGQREPCVLGRKSLEWNLHPAELELGRKKAVLVQISQTLIYPTKFL